MWIPDSKGIYPDLLATSGDYLRVWRAGEPDTHLECVLNNNKNSDFCAPLTSFDWNEVDPNLVGTSSIDTTCTIWGLETGQPHARVYVAGHVKTQLIAHDKEVYDIAFSRAGGGRDMFASVGADGSVRMFDLRHLEHSTIIYEVDANSFDIYIYVYIYCLFIDLFVLIRILRILRCCAWPGTNRIRIT